ncbi:MAG: two-component system, OmpR family, operon response regulator KdpE [Frankiaceae bacterium]|jgi:two-component system KDP operon response regulator KdpE|nr:two-component system, OmpR family, operon response regulator KdpE [Frankiaceae bacterium]
MNATILVVDDERHILSALTSRLSSEGYRVLGAADGETALEIAATAAPDLVVLDMGLPGIQGPEVVRRLRTFSVVPVLILSALDRDADKVAALDAGADDYVIKPFSLDELLARLRALFRRAETAAAPRPPVVRAGRAVVDLATRTVTRDGEPVRLTATEWALLDAFLANPGKLLTRHQLINAVWGSSHGSEASSLRLYVSHLRRIIEAEPANPVHLLTEVGAGYRLVGVEEFVLPS